MRMMLIYTNIDNTNHTRDMLRNAEPEPKSLSPNPSLSPTAQLALVRPRSSWKITINLLIIKAFYVKTTGHDV